MTGFEVTVVVVLFLVGYWLVSALWPKRAGEKLGPSDRPASHAASDRTGTDPQPNDAWHRVLGVPETASIDGIKRAYHLQLSKYHPDKVAQLGPELQAIAHEMTQKINAAYDQALRVRQ